MNELALFAGAGGGILASHLLGWRTVCAVERDDYARNVLLARQNDGNLEPFPVWDDVNTFDGRPWRGVAQVVSGGFPCQDISIARAMWGRAGIRGKRSGLVWGMLRIVDEVQPVFVWGENSPELEKNGLVEIRAALAEMGYRSEYVIMGADDIGGLHRRKRLWFIAYSDSARLEGHSRHDAEPERRQNQNGPPANALVFECPFCGYQMETDDRYGCPNCNGEGLDDCDCGAGILPGITGMADGVAYRVDRLRAIGNGQVPAVAAAAWDLLLARFRF